MSHSAADLRDELGQLDFSTVSGSNGKSGSRLDLRVALVGLAISAAPLRVEVAAAPGYGQRQYRFALPTFAV